ncbi:MAG: hypothetical protein IKD89_04395 [Clostridia bacterium]|nr:hypothetical protein [Clostridia bacterium]
MKRDIISSIKISSSFLGSLIGAGFASGQEVMIYFGAFGRAGGAGVAVCAALLFGLVSGVCLILYKTGARDFYELLKIACGRAAARVFSAVFLSFSFIAFGVMAAGFGESVSEHLGADRRIGALLFLIIMALVMRAGERGVVAVNVALAPVMTAAALFVSVFILCRGGISASGPPPNAVGSAVLYAGYNAILGVAVIAQLSHLVHSRRVGLISALISSGAFGALIFVLWLLMTRNYAALSPHGIPMLYAASTIHPVMGHVYFAALLMAMITTGACCGFSVCGSLGLSMRRGAYLLPVCALPFIMFDFQALIARLYSLFGIAGAALMLIVLFRAARLRARER